MSRIDYSNSLLYGVAATSLSKLQRVQNAAVRLVCSLPRHEHVTSSFIRLHWLPIKFRINFKIAMHSWTRPGPQLPKKHCRHQEDFDQNTTTARAPVSSWKTISETIEKNALRSSSLFQYIRQDLERSPAIITVTAKF